MKYLIVGNGPFLAKSIIAEIARDACIIALDGAAKKLAQLGLKPNIILGDFDSIREDIETTRIWGITQSFDEIEEVGLFSEPYVGNFNTTIIPAKNQNFTDFQKALKFSMLYATNYGLPLASSIHVVCATGGRMDHDQANFRALQSEYSKSCPIFLHNESQTMRFVSNETITIVGQHDDHCGLFGMPYAAMCVKNGGLEYGGPDFYELNPSQYSSSNLLKGSNGAIVEIRGDALIINPPQFESQRIYAQKTRQEQLEELLQDSKKVLYMGKASQCKRALDNLSDKNDIICVSHEIDELDSFGDELVLMSVPQERCQAMFFI